MNTKPCYGLDIVKVTFNELRLISTQNLMTFPIAVKKLLIKNKKCPWFFFAKCKHSMQGQYG